MSMSLSIIFFAQLCEKNPTSSKSNTVTDIDGNVYQIVKIGDQWWMAENLKVTHYRNGDVIPNVTDNAEWYNLTTSAYCIYDNNSANVETYGCLYNWYAVADSRNIAPSGWHVPSDAEWTTLADYLGGVSAAGGKMKETGTEHWASPNSGAINECGFSALPGGYRSRATIQMGEYAYFWSYPEGDNLGAWYRFLYFNNSEFGRLFSSYKLYGFSIRLVKD